MTKETKRRILRQVRDALKERKIEIRRLIPQKPYNEEELRTVRLRRR